MADPAVSITRDMELPAILSRFPERRKVFDRYGLVGCGGPLGPQEQLAFFARAHGLDECRLLAELNETARTGVLQPGSPEYTPGPDDVIYRRFFRAAILTMFTFGCVLGGINLAIIASTGQLASLDMRAITWAHLHAQVAGWVTFFVMGFAYQSIPRFKFTTLWQPLLASRSLFVMAAAVTVYRIQSRGVTDPLDAVFCRDSITVRFPAESIVIWTAADEVGLYAQQGALKIAVEKDFRSLTRRPNELEPDAYPHPAE